MADMVKGNDAIAEAAVRAGVELYAGYPITPSTEVMEYLSWRMPQEGRTFIQAENELASINMVLGFAACDKRAMTASSGPGISLKQEGISYISKYRFPCVVLNVVRYGNGLGSLRSGQSDYLRDTRGGERVTRGVCNTLAGVGYGAVQVKKNDGSLREICHHAPPR